MREEIRALVQRLEVIPEAMSAEPQWLVWRFIKKAGQDKPSKVPFYVNGHPRGWPNGKPRAVSGQKVVPTEAQPQVDQGHELDRAALVNMQQAIEALEMGRWDGLGFAFLPGDGLIGIDVDKAIDPATGEIAEHCLEIINRCGSYTELSPSGTGVHVIVHGETETFKDNGVGVEVFCGRQFFTVTGNVHGWGGRQVEPITDDTVAWLREMVKGKPSPAVSPEVQRTLQASADADKSARRYCMAALESAVQRMRNAGSGSRNNTLNTEAYGLAQLVNTGGISETTIRAALSDAARGCGLADAEIDATMSSGIRAGLAEPRRLPERERRPSHPPSREVHAPGASAEHEPAWVAASSLPPSTDDAAPRARPRGKGPASAEQDDAFGLRVDGLAGRFFLIENTLTAWDTQDEAVWQIANMRVRFGQAAVKAWLSRVADERAQTVKLVDLVFEPGLEVPDHQINMFSGLTVKPVPCEPSEVEPMLELLRHLCSQTVGGAADEPGTDLAEEVVHWILCWQALPIQRVGTKMQTACVFHGAQGTGKNLYWDIWRDLFGVFGITVGQTEIEDKFNGWISRKLAIIGDEVVSRQEMYHNKNRLKSVVTQEKKFPIRGMQQETRWESNHANVVFLSNEAQPLALEERDRRYLVIYTPLEADPSLYQRVRQFRDNDGLGKWMHYLMTYPLGKFDAHTKPIMTKAKEALIELNWKPPERFIHEWLEGYLDLPLRVCSAEQLYRAFRRWCDRQGERWPPNQAVFTTSIQRFVGERVKRITGVYEAPRLAYKQIALKNEITTHRKTVRCWVPLGTGAPNGVSEGVWAHDSVVSFENDLAKFCRGHAVHDEQV